jgi:hypothetical protein
MLLLPQVARGGKFARRVKSLEAPRAFYLVTGWAAEVSPQSRRPTFVDGVIAKPVNPKTVDDLLAEHKPESISLPGVAAAARRTPS